MEEQRSQARAIIMRPGVGAAGRVVQPTRLRAHRVTIDLPTLILVEEGRKRVQWTGGECTASPGDAVALAAGQVVEISNIPEPSGFYKARWISWSFEMLDAFRSSSTSIAPFAVATLLPRLTSEFLSAYRSAFDSLLDLAGVPTAVADHRLREVLVWLQERGVCFPAAEPDRISLRLRRLLLSDPAHPWSIEEVASYAKCSPATLRRRLAADDLSFREVLQDVRMSYALTLLHGTDTPVLSIALAVGYDSASRFSARFRSRFGYLPSDVRGHKRGTQAHDVNPSVALVLLEAHDYDGPTIRS